MKAKEIREMQLTKYYEEYEREYNQNKNIPKRYIYEAAKKQTDLFMKTFIKLLTEKISGQES